MSDWDASSDEETSKKVSAPSAATGPVATTIGGRRRFDDEEEEIKDDWEEDDEEPKEPAQLAPAKKKGTLKQKLAEKEEEERRRQELGIDSDEDEEEEEDPAERRRREKDAQLKADLDNAANLLGVNRISGGGDDELSKIRNAKPVSKEDWEALASQAYEAAIKPQSSRAGYEKYFGPHLITLICRDMRDVDMRLMSTRLKDMAEKKTKAEKEAKKNGGVLKKPKPKNTSTASAKNTVDTTNYDENVEEDLDFM